MNRTYILSSLFAVAALAMVACDKKDEAAPGTAPSASASAVAPAGEPGKPNAEEHGRHFEGDGGGRPGEEHGHDRPH